MKRRELISILGGAAMAAPQVAIAQTSNRTFRLGVLTPGPPLGVDSANAKVLLGAMALHGYTLGRNLTYEARGAGGQNAKLAPLLQELKAGGVDAIVTVGYPTTLAAKTAAIPTVVASGVGDPVATGLIDSLARPGGTITGISDVAATLSIKRLSLLKELSPKLARVAMLWNRDDLGMSLRYEASASAARSLGVTVQPLGVREPDDFDGVFEAMNREPPDAILMVSDSLTVLNRKRVFDYAAAKRLPAIYEFDSLVRDGGLMSYGADLKESFERAAALVDRIFKGAKPSDLPFEQPTRYLFVINLKTAKAIGLDIPPTLLARADETVE
jgi:putative ABC transport system substrate-binding protein